MNTSGEKPCPSDLVLDRYLVGELDTSLRHDVESHTEGCSRCRSLLEERREQARLFSAAPTLPSRAAATLARFENERPAPWWSRPRTWATGFAAAAAAGLVAVVVLRGGLLHPGSEEIGSVRLKGSLALSAFVKRGETVERARSGEVFHPGDALRFAYSTEHDGYLAIASVDAKQVVSVYYPVEHDRAAAIPAGVGKLLPGSTILDETLGLETVIGVHCLRPFAVADLRQRAQPILTVLREGKDAASLLPQRDCRAARFELRKER
jgi:hypothetical protein